MLVFVQATSYVGFIVVWILFGLGVGLFSPAYSSLISKVVPRHTLGAFNGIFYSSMGFISLPAPWAGAQLWTHYTPKLPFQITAVAALLTIIPTWFKFKLPDKPLVEGIAHPNQQRSARVADRLPETPALLYFIPTPHSDCGPAFLLCTAPGQCAAAGSPDRCNPRLPRPPPG